MVKTRWVSLTRSQSGRRSFTGEAAYGSQKNNVPPRCRAGSTHPCRIRRSFFLICPDDDRKYPSRQGWSELQRDDRIAAECVSHPLPRNKFSLSSWQAVAARAALPRSCSDQRMLIRRTQGRISQLQIGPTSRTRDSVWLLFPCHHSDTVPNSKQALFPHPLRIFGPAHFLQSPRGMLQSVQRKCSSRILFRRAFASSLRLPATATSLS